MLDLRDLRELEWQTLSMLRPYSKDKTKGYTDQAETDGAAADKENIETVSAYFGFIFHTSSNVFIACFIQSWIALVPQYFSVHLLSQRSL